MSRAGYTTLLCAALLLGLAVPARTQDSTEHVARARVSVMRLAINGYDPMGERRHPEAGSAFVVHSDDVLQETYLLTAGHVIDRPDKWLLDDSSKVKDRVIAVYRVTASEQLELVHANAAVVGEDHELDVAVLAIPRQSFAPLPLVTSRHLKQNQGVLSTGFPASSGDFIAKPSQIRSLKLAKSHVEIHGRVEPGQSGGPVIDSAGRVIALVSENNSKQNPEFHRAAIVSAAVDLLNTHMRKRGYPQLKVEDAFPMPGSFAIANRAGRAAVRLEGTNFTPGQNLADEQALGIEASRAASGDEKSECDEAAGRTHSQARAKASVQNFELAGLRMHFDLYAHGGHYRRKAACLAGIPVGITGIDTTAVARAEGTGVLTFRVASSPLDLRIVWQDMPRDSQLLLTGPDNQEFTQIPAENDSFRMVRIPSVGDWQLQIRAIAETRAEGSVDRSSVSRRPLVFLEAR